MHAILLIGKGFLGTYINDLFVKEGVDFVATTRDGRDGTVQWGFPEEFEKLDEPIDFSALPAAQTVVITFPLKGEEFAETLVDGYLKQHSSLEGFKPNWIYIGSTRGFKEIPSTRFTVSDVAAGGVRVEAEEFFIAKHNAQVLNLAGLWGGKRAPRNWGRFFTDKKLLRTRLSLRERSLHLTHCTDAARVVLAVARQNSDGHLPAGRWLVSDGNVYDMLEELLADPVIRGLVEELIQEPEVQAMVGATEVDQIKLGDSVVTMRINPAHTWEQFGLQPKFPYVLHSDDPFQGEF
ncbi:hypothetical protein FBU59_000205 [Linderina macrospora]|uniref:Uncharacterized protein n=1 Tax=Linderina macrospora TaxID=4868 RepID=A0ACC1JHP1_9FUNG|nr:hypothetical protein FBU59_000205 [Linderina macrospora]